MPVLMWLFIIPFIASILAAFIPFSGRQLKTLAIALSVLPLLFLIYVHATDFGTPVTYSWIPSLSINFSLKVDALSLLFLYLTTILIPVSLLPIRSGSTSNTNSLYALVLFLQGLLIGFFTTNDLVLFTLFWESMLLPLYFIINLWGGEQRQKAAIKFLIYMIAGSTLMIVGVLSLYFAAASTTANAAFNFGSLAKSAQTIPFVSLVAFIFFLAFAVKTPLFPFHGWLPDVYYQAETTGTILLSAILSKAGIYGFLRIGMEFFPQQMMNWSSILLGLAIAGVFYGGLSAWRQKDFKRLLAYSSFSHVNFILIGIFVWNQSATAGAILQSLNHAITISSLFLVAGWLEERLGTTRMDFSGLAKFFPYLCWITLFFVLSSVALPGTNNFIGELLILFGLFINTPWLAAFTGLSVILSAMYMLRWMQKMYFEKPSNYQPNWIDITSREITVAIPLAALILWVGLYPSPVLKQIDIAVQNIVDHAEVR